MKMTKSTFPTNSSGKVAATHGLLASLYRWNPGMLPGRSSPGEDVGLVTRAYVKKDHSRRAFEKDAGDR